jgi:MYXO-CTERM domain-containing protein
MTTTTESHLMAGAYHRPMCRRALFTVFSGRPPGPTALLWLALLGLALARARREQ